MKWIAGILTFSWMALLFSCAAPLKRSAPPVLTTQIHQWPERYQANYQQIHTFEGTARLTVESPQVNGHVNIRVIWIDPDTLFVQAEGAFGVNVGKIFIGKRRFLIYNEYDNQYIAGELTNAYIARFLNTDFSLKDLQAALLGKPLAPVSGARLVDAKRGVFALKAGSVKHRYKVDPETGLLEKWEMLRDGRVIVRMEFQRYRKQNGIYFPGLIRLTQPERQERITVFYKTLMFNRPINPARYRITIDPRARQLNL
ncbi:MAG: DUF4292 domain-containing protein [Calditrichaeota bacterium]|nr:DUF4292 domain-containing protein [Calditrichota bacterium]